MDLHYQVDEKPPPGLTLGLGLQLAVISVTAPILIPTVVMRAAGAAEAYLNWAVFAAIVISGVTTVLQTIRYGRVGAGNVLVTGSSGAFIAICITALTDSGPAVLATLVVAAALFQLLIAEKLALLRTILTPAVSGTVIMLIPVSVMPVVFDLMTVAEPGVSATGSLLSAGATFVAMAFLPKVLAVVLAIPGPVFAAYLAVLLAMLFIVGMRMVILEGGGPQYVLIAGIAFWVGIGFENGAIFPQVFTDFAGGFLQNGMTAGGITVILLTLFLSLTEPRRGRIRIDYKTSAQPEIRRYLDVFAGANGWGNAMASRLEDVVTETMQALFPDDAAGHRRPRLVLSVRKEGAAAVLDLVVSGAEKNLEDGFMSLGDQPGDNASAAPLRDEADGSLRRLRELASSVRHQQFHDTDILTIRVEPT